MKYAEQIVITKNLLEDYTLEVPRRADDRDGAAARRTRTTSSWSSRNARRSSSRPTDGKSVAVSQVHEDEHTDYYHVAVVGRRAESA